MKFDQKYHTAKQLKCSRYKLKEKRLREGWRKGEGEVVEKAEERSARGSSPR